MRCWLHFLLLLVVWVPSSFAKDINLILGHQSTDDRIAVNVYNNSAVSVWVDRVFIEIDGEKYEQVYRSEIGSHLRAKFNFRIKYPNLPGSYILTAVARYRNETKLLSIKHAAMFHYISQAMLNEDCHLSESYVSGKGGITLYSDNPGAWQLVLPDEVIITGTNVTVDSKVFKVKDTMPGFGCNYAIFAVAEKAVAGKNYAAIRHGVLHTKPTKKESFERGRLPSISLLIQCILFWCAATYFILFGRTESRITGALGKYAARMFFLTGFYYILKKIDIWLYAMLPHIGWEPCRYFVDMAANNFSGSNYRYFFIYFVDWYWAGCLLISLPYLYWFDSDTLHECDKYVCFLKTLISVGNLLVGRRLYWDCDSRLGMLTLAVKVFYIPYLTSWVINNTIHQKNLLGTFHWEFYTINAFLVAFFIYIDTIVFCFGYIVEAPFLKNKIKSVEPTVLGWIVCLWCYPPFNIFSFRIFDVRIFDITHLYPLWINVLMTCMISLLWGIFTWASVALGFKASNLTNRGIIAKGPYAYVRHPAYTAKLLLWVIEGFFFGKYFIGLILGFILIYVLRAWTEERHLCADQDYVAYKKKVRWMFVPGVV